MARVFYIDMQIDGPMFNAGFLSFWHVRSQNSSGKISQGKYGKSMQFSGDSWMYPYQRTPIGNPYINPIYSGYLYMGYNPQESLENTINTMGTLLGVHPIVP